MNPYWSWQPMNPYWSCPECRRGVTPMREICVCGADLTAYRLVDRTLPIEQWSFGDWFALGWGVVLMVLFAIAVVAAVV